MVHGGEVLPAARPNLRLLHLFGVKQWALNIWKHLNHSKHYANASFFIPPSRFLRQVLFVRHLHTAGELIIFML